MLIETDVRTPDGRVIHAYDTVGPAGRLPIVWHHGTPNVGAPPAPLASSADRLGLRWVSYDRPGYGGSTPHPGRDRASAAADVAIVVDALGIEEFAVVGHSGSASHALASAALSPGGFRRWSPCRRWLRTPPTVSTGSPEWRTPGSER